MAYRSVQTCKTDDPLHLRRNARTQQYGNDGDLTNLLLSGDDKIVPGASNSSTMSSPDLRLVYPGAVGVGDVVENTYSTTPGPVALHVVGSTSHSHGTSTSQMGQNITRCHKCKMATLGTSLTHVEQPPMSPSAGEPYETEEHHLTQGSIQKRK